MIKGHVQIDLHNHKTGLKDRIEQDNMVTDAIPDTAEAYADWGHRITEFSSLVPLCTNGLGGLLLFNNTLTENVKNYHFPSNAKLIAYAARDADVSNTRRGSLNAIETGWVDSETYMNVWDFSTSQANGIIKSLALTHYHIGSNPLNYINVIENFRFGHTPCFVDYETNDVYTFRKADGCVYYDKSKKYLNDIPIGGIFGDYEYLDDPVIAINPGYLDGFPAGYRNYWYYEGYIYFVYRYERYYISLARMNVETGAVEYNLLDFGYGTSEPNIAVVNGYLYYSSWGSGGFVGLRKKSLSDLSGDYTEINTGIQAGYCVTSIGGGLIVHGTSGLSVIVYPDDSMDSFPVTMDSTDSNSTAGAINCDNGMLAQRGYGNFITYKNYLGTICNLAQPVEKTSELSMKIKYTITNAE